MTLRLTSVLASVAAAVVLAGCGGDDSSSRRAAPISADGSSTVGPYVTAAAEDFKDETGTTVTVGISGTGGGFERFCRGETDLSNASRPISTRTRCALRGRRRRVRRVPGRERRAHGHRQPRERLGDLPHRRGAEADLEARLDGRQLEPGARRATPMWRSSCSAPGTDSGTFDYFTDAINGEEGASRTDYSAERGRQRHRAGRRRRPGRARLPRLLVLRGEPGQAEGARGRRRRGLRRAERRDRTGRRLHAALPAAVRLREAERARASRRSTDFLRYILDNERRSPSRRSSSRSTRSSSTRTAAKLDERDRVVTTPDLTAHAGPDRRRDRPAPVEPRARRAR